MNAISFLSQSKIKCVSAVWSLSVVPIRHPENYCELREMTERESLHFPLFWRWKSCSRGASCPALLALLTGTCSLIEEAWRSQNLLLLPNKHRESVEHLLHILLRVIRNTHTHTRRLTQLWTLSPCLSVAIRFNQPAERRMRSALWPLLMSSRLTKHTHFKTRSLFGEMTSSSARVPLRSRLAGNPSHHSRDYPGEWLLHTYMRDCYDESDYRYTAPPAAPPPIPSSRTWARLIVHSITDRWMEQIMERSISVTLYRWAMYVCLWWR